MLFRSGPNVCLGQYTQFANGTIEPAGYSISYLWDFGDNGASIQTNPNHLYLNAGVYNVTLTATTNTTPPCSNSYSTQVEVYTNPVIGGQIIHN